MPFKSPQQTKACFAKYYNDVNSGRKPKWDCYKWLREGKYFIYKGKRRYIYIGIRGGEYIMYQNKKIYINSL